MSADAYFCKQPIEEYLADLSRTSGSVLSMVERSPEEYGLHMAGKLKRRSSPAMNQGEYFHARLLEPDEVPRRFAFAPSRSEDGPGRWKAVDRRTKDGKKAWQVFLDASPGLVHVHPEQQRVVEAMVRAVMRHERAAELLEGIAPELTGHWTCPITGELMQCRPDGLKRRSRVWLELKSIAPKGSEDRLDTTDPFSVQQWARAGWARKSALLHDGCTAIDGGEWTGYWIVVEALSPEMLDAGHEPRVSVVDDHAEVDEVPCFYTWGKNGLEDKEGRRVLRGYLELVLLAQELRVSQSYHHACTRGVVPGWALPTSWLTMHEDPSKKPPPIIGARMMEVPHGA